ncbi:MAG TPA: hypothetical protein VHF89_04320 [Solirubrobacteraceae bacterium]|nr:hypothetical protein [Solirubrobacteraceae bacterium]
MHSRRNVALVALAALSVLVVAAWHGQGTWNHAKAFRDATTASPTLGALFSRAVVRLERPGDEACLEPVTFYAETGRARFRVQSPRSPGPRVEIVAAGPGYRATAVSPTLPPQTEGLVDLEFERPGREVTGSFCFRNRGPTPVQLIGTNEGRSLTIVDTTLNGRPREGEEIELILLKRGRHSLRSRRSELIERAASLTGGLAPTWVLWPVAILLFGSPLLVAAAYALGVASSVRGERTSAGRR